MIYELILTDAGAAEIEAAWQAGKTVNIPTAAFGDGGGAPVEADPSATALAGPLGEVPLVAGGTGEVLIGGTAVIPCRDYPGAVLREFGLMSEAGTLIAYGAYPETYLPGQEDSIVKEVVVTFAMPLVHAESVTLVVDPNIAVITMEEGDRRYYRQALRLKEVADAGTEAQAEVLGNLNGVPASRKINGHGLDKDFDVTAQDIFSGQAVSIGDAADLNTFTTPGLYYQPANAQAASGKNYPEKVSGSLEVYKHAGITQIYRIYISSRSYIRTRYGDNWSAWTKQYDADNKPSGDDVNAITRDGCHIAGFASGDKARPYMRFTKDDQVVELAKKGDSYTKAESDAGYQPKGDYTPAGTAYTKSESDGRYLQNMQLGAQTSIGKEGDHDQTYQCPPGCIMTGTFVSDGDGREAAYTTAYYKPIQKYINNKWITISG